MVQSFAHKAKVFVRYKTEKQVEIGLLYSKFAWESSDRLIGEYNYIIINLILNT